MPKYVYFCKSCENNFEIKHALQKIYTICEICNVDGELERKPSSIFLTKKQSSFAEILEPGAVIKDAIEEAHHDITVEKHRLKNREYKK